MEGEAGHGIIVPVGRAMLRNGTPLVTEVRTLMPKDQHDKLVAIGDAKPVKHFK